MTRKRRPLQRPVRRSCRTLEPVRVSIPESGAVLGHGAAEHEAGSKSMFGKMDSDMDGSVSEAEMKAGHKTIMGKKSGK